MLNNEWQKSREYLVRMHFEEEPHQPRLMPNITEWFRIYKVPHPYVTGIEIEVEVFEKET